MALTEKQARALKPGDKPVFDGKVTGLMLTPTASGGKWTLRYTSPETGKRREMGLGTYPQVSIADAPDKALDERKILDGGSDPLEARRRKRAKQKPSLRPRSPSRRPRASFTRNCGPAGRTKSTLRSGSIPSRPMSSQSSGPRSSTVTSPKDCADVLRPILLTKPETASRTRQRMHAVMQWAWAHGHITANPLTVVDHIAEAGCQGRASARYALAQCEHLADDVPGDMGRAALKLLILTAARSGEVRFATWSEFELDAKVWRVPAERMKTRVSHRVPLSKAAVALITGHKEEGRHDTLVFPSPRDGKLLSDMVLTSLLRRVNAKSDTSGRVATAHGFRSSFRDWASEHR